MKKTKQKLIIIFLFGVMTASFLVYTPFYIYKSFLKTPSYTKQANKCLNSGSDYKTKLCLTILVDEIAQELNKLVKKDRITRESAIDLLDRYIKIRDSVK